MSKQNFPHTNKFRSLFGIGASILFIYIGILLFSKSTNYGINPWILKGIGIITILFFGGLLAYGIKKIIRKSKFI